MGSNKGRSTNLENTKVHLTSVYTRHSKPKRTFSLIMSGLLIGAALLGAIPVNEAHAAASPSTTNQSITSNLPQPPHLSETYNDEEVLLTNLSEAVRIIEESGWSVAALGDILDSLQSIEDKLAQPSGFARTSELKPLILNTERVLVAHGSDGLPTMRSQRTIQSHLDNIKKSLKMDTTPSKSKSEVKIASATSSSGGDGPWIVINGLLQSYFEHPPMIVDGSTLLPLRSIFTQLKAEVDWDASTQTVTATRAGTTIKLTINDPNAYVNGKLTTLETPPQLIDNTTYVPLRFIAEAFNTVVTWDANTQTAFIMDYSPHKGSNAKINVLYGMHTYKSADQSEYDRVLEIVNASLKGVDQIPFGGQANMEPYFYEFLDGARWTGNTKDRTQRNIGLKLAENSIGDLVSAGLSKEEIVKAYKVMMVAAKLVYGKESPNDGTPKSAYDTLVRGISDCDADAQVYSAVFDAMGYNTGIIASVTHGEILIKIGDVWFTTVAGQFQKVDVKSALKQGYRMLENPTLGTPSI